jgi:hypothetical protein
MRTENEMLLSQIPKVRAMRDRFPVDDLAVHRLFNLGLFRLESLTFDPQQYAALILMFIGLGIDSPSALRGCVGRRNGIDEAIKGLVSAGYIEKTRHASPAVFYKLTQKGNEWWIAAAMPDLLEAAKTSALNMPIILEPSDGVSMVKSRQTQVYLFHKKGTTLYKIGVSTDIDRRLKELNAGHEHRLYCAASMPGDFEIEHHLHKVNARFRSVWNKKTEWFRFQSHERAMQAFLQKESYE